MAFLLFGRRAGVELVLASLLALLSYVPFDLVAKLTLIVCAVTFVADPFPPMSRLVSVLAVAVVAGLAKALRAWNEAQELEIDREGCEETAADDEESTEWVAGQREATEQDDGAKKDK
jgi:hypothetical protein